MRYRVLYIPGYVTRVTLPMIRKMRDLVAAGAILVGNKPKGGLGVDSPDAAVLAVADEIWSGKSAHVHANADLGAALAVEKIAPDVAVRGAETRPSIHVRTSPSRRRRLYFISNRQTADETHCN